MYSQTRTAVTFLFLSLPLVAGVLGCRGGGEQAQHGDKGRLLFGARDSAKQPAVSGGDKTDSPAGTEAAVQNSGDPGSGAPASTENQKIRIDSAELDEAVATVRGEKILMRDLLEELLDLHGANLLEEMVTRLLVRQEWNRLGIAFTPEELEHRIEQEIAVRSKELAEQAGTPDAFEAFLNFHGHNLDSFKTLLRTNENFAHQLRLECWFVLTGLTQDKVEVQHILADTKEAAAEALDKLDKGADFAKLAAEISIDSFTKETGGKLAPFILGLSPLGVQFDEAAFSLKNSGDLSGVVKTDLGFHVIRLTARIPGQKGTFESLKNRILASLDAGLPDKELLVRWFRNYRRMNESQIEIHYKKKE